MDNRKQIKMARQKSTEQQKNLSKQLYAEKLKQRRIREREALEQRRKEVLRKLNTVYLKPNHEEIKQAIEKSNEKKLVVKKGLNCYTNNL